MTNIVETVYATAQSHNKFDRNAAMKVRQKLIFVDKRDFCQEAKVSSNVIPYRNSISKWRNEETRSK